MGSKKFLFFPFFFINFFNLKKEKKMFKSQNQQYPIIIVQDTQHGNISTTSKFFLYTHSNTHKKRAL